MRNSFARVLCVSLVLASPAAASRLTILATSDLHGHIEPVDELAQRDFGQGLARVAAYVREVRGTERHVLLLDAGDTIEGTPLEAMHARSGAAGDPTIRVMNALRYDAMCVGNHDFNFGLDVLGRARKDARFPFLAANVLRRDGTPAFRPYAVFVRGGVRIGVLGLITTGVPDWEERRHIGGLSFADPVAVARKEVPVLRGRERCAVVIVLTHEGFERDPRTGREAADPEWRSENRAYALATEVPGVDFVLAGHAHANVPPVKVGTVWASEPGRYGSFVTRYDVDVEGGKIASVRGENVAMKAVVADPGVLALVARDTEKADRELSRPVASLTRPVDFGSVREEDSGVLDWIQKVQLAESGADVSFASFLPGQLRGWPAGPLTVREIWSLYPYENALVKVRATGKEVRAALERAGTCLEGPVASGGAVVWKRNRALFDFNCDALEGAEYAFDPTRPEGSRLLYLRRNGRDVGDGDVLTVALNSYRAAGGGGYGMWRAAPRLWTSMLSVRDLLLAAAGRDKTLDPVADFNWFWAPMLPEAP